MGPAPRLILAFRLLFGPMQAAGSLRISRLYIVFVAHASVNALRTIFRDFIHIAIEAIMSVKFGASLEDG